MRYLFLLLLFISAPVFAAAPFLQTPAKQAIIVDYDTGIVLFEKNADQRMPTSSMSKVMTMYAVFDALEKKKIALDDTFLVSEKAWRKGGSKMFVEVDKQVKIEDLIRGVIIQSGNDATIVLAEGLAGSEEAFAAGLTEKAQELGMVSSNFTNASGWPDEEHYSTAQDLATLALALIRNFPQYYDYYSETEFTFNDITQPNRNPLLYRNIGADGIKTGHTEAGGYGLIGSGTHEGRRVVFVVNGLESEKARASEAAKLLNWGLKSVSHYTLYTAGQAVESVDVAYGTKPTVKATVAEDLKLPIPKVSKAYVKLSASFNAPVKAPIQQGQEIGTLLVEIPGLETQSIPLVAAETVEEQGFFAKAITKIKLLLGQG